ncbi:MATE family efflux transporter [Lachnospiraceae bacterium AM48-27BH]|nr:MATE family efflux transporter [Lachnospiraceae bacterium AM48-27BH]
MFTRKDLVKLLLPLIVEQLLAVLVGMADVVMVAAVGETAVSGVSLVDSISILIIQMLAALATGGSVVCAQYIGKKQPENACEAAGQLILITTMVSAVIAVVALLGNRHLLSMIFGKVEDSVMENAQIYFWLSALSYPFLAVYNSCAALYRAMGNSKVSMYASLVMNAINIAGNAICVFGLHMGVEGVGIPTLISRAFAAILMLFLIQRPQNVIRIRNLQELRFNGRMIEDILKVGVPNGMENTMFQFGKLFLQSLVSSLGTVAIASYAVASNLVTFEYLVGNAIGLGIITIVGQCVGAGEWEQAKQYTKKLVLVNYAALVVICSLMILFRNQVVGIYNLSPEATRTSAEMLFAHSLAMVVWPLAFTIPYSLRASFDAPFTMYVSVASMWIFRIASAYFFVKVLNLGVMGVWYGMYIDWVFRGLLFVKRFHHFGQKRKNL